MQDLPEIDISLRCVNYADKNDETEIITGPYPQRVIDEANQDLDVFCKFLQDESIEVLRPNGQIVSIIITAQRQCLYTR